MRERILLAHVSGKRLPTPLPVLFSLLPLTNGVTRNTIWLVCKQYRPESRSMSTTIRISVHRSITIRIDGDVAAYIQEHGKFGESHNDVLRRLLPDFKPK